MALYVFSICIIKYKTIMDDNDRTALVQQRIKKMLQNKKRSNNRQSGDLTKRLKSNLGDKIYPEEQDQVPKPNSSVRLRRPTSAMKAAESTKTITNNTMPKPDIDVRPIIAFVFDHGVKLKDFVKQKRLNRQDICQKISEDQLFLLRLIGILRECAEESWNDMVEKMCIQKIGRMLSRQQLIRKCQQSQRRVSSMIEERLKTLERY